MGLGLPLLVGARGEESCTVRVAERLDVSVLAAGEGVGESCAGAGVVDIDALNVFGEGAPPCFECGVALAVDFAGLNDVGAVCEDVPVLDVRGVLFIGTRDGLGGFC